VSYVSAFDKAPAAQSLCQGAPKIAGQIESGRFLKKTAQKPLCNWAASISISAAQMKSFASFCSQKEATPSVALEHD
jgi:hypothetical protein